MTAHFARESARGSFILLVGNFISTGILAAATIVIARLLGPEGYGVYSLSFVIPSILLALFGFGVNSAVTRYAAYHISRGELEIAVRITKRAAAFLLLFGLALSFVNFAGADFLTKTLLHREGLTVYVQIGSLFILGQAILQSSLSSFIGWNSMGKVTLFTVLQAVSKLALSVGLIVVGLGVYGAILGHAASYLFSGSPAILVLYILNLRAKGGSWVGFSSDVRMMMGYGLPLFAGSIISGLAGQYLTIILAAIATNTVIGYYQAAINVTVAITVISGALATSLFPAFAMLDGMRGDVASAYVHALKYVAFLLTPIVFFLIGSANLLFSILFGPLYSQGAAYLQLLAVSYLPVIIGLTVTPSFLNGVGRSRMTMLLLACSSVSLLVAGPVLAITAGLGVSGIIYATLASNLVSAGLGLFLAVRYFRAKIEAKPLLGILGSAAISYIPIFLLSFSKLQAAPLLVLDVPIFGLVYLTLVPFLHGISVNDLDNLLQAIEGLGALKPPVLAVLSYERRMLGIKELLLR